MLSQQSGPTFYARLQFDGASACVAWMETLPLSKTIDAHEMLTAQFELLVGAEIDALEKLRILELMCQTAMHLQAQMARKVIGRALPLSIVEYSIWSSVVSLWQTMLKCYQLILRRALKGDAALAPHAPLLALRCVDFAAAAVREHHHVYREVPAHVWKQLNECYTVAERHGLAPTAIDDPLEPESPRRSCTAAYGGALVAHLSNPFTMSPRQMSVMYRWTGLWSSLISLDPSPRAPKVTSALAVDIRSGMPARPASDVDAAHSVRYLDLEELGTAMRRLIAQLRAGESPGRLGLGDDCRQPGCERLLTLLYIQWCGSGIAPLARSGEHGEDARACVGLERVLRQLATENEAFRAAAATIRTAFSAYTEHWNITNANTPGFIGVVRGPECDERILHHQLIALKRRSVAHFQLAVSQWLRQEDDGELSIGLRLLPGVPHVTAYQPEDTQAGAEGVGSIILLPAAPELRTGATLILEPGVFRPGRVLRLLSGSARRVRLVRLTERGADFERAAFDLLA